MSDWPHYIWNMYGPPLHQAHFLNFNFCQLWCISKFCHLHVFFCLDFIYSANGGMEWVAQLERNNQQFIKSLANESLVFTRNLRRLKCKIDQQEDLTTNLCIFWREIAIIVTFILTHTTLLSHRWLIIFIIYDIFLLSF